MNATSENQNVAVARAYFEAAHRDLDALLALIDPEGAIHVPPSLPYGGVYRGHEGFRQAIAAYGRAWTDVESTDFEFFASGDTVVVLSRMRARAVTSDRMINMRVAELFRMKNGKVVEVWPFNYDTTAMINVLSAST